MYSRDESRVWTMTLEPSDVQDRNEEHDEAVVRYMTIFDKAFTKASETCEAEFVKALLRIMEDVGRGLGSIRNDAESDSREW